MLLYGESPQGLVDSRGLTMEEAQDTFHKVLSAMPQMEKVIEITNSFAEQQGYVETISGHVRRLPEATQNRNPALKSRAIRQCFNAVVQGSGAVCTNTALIYIRKAIRDYHLKSRIVITVHDSIVLDVHPSEINIVPKLAQQIMQHLPIKNFILNTDDYKDLKVADKYKINDHQFRFPLFAEMAFGKTYGDDLDFDQAECDKLGIEKYYQYSMECKKYKDIYNTQLKTEKAEDKKAEIVDKMNNKLAEIKKSYLG